MIGASRPAVPVSSVRPRPGAELALALAAAERARLALGYAGDQAAGRANESQALNAEKLNVYHSAAGGPVDLSEDFNQSAPTAP